MALQRPLEDKRNVQKQEQRCINIDLCLGQIQLGET